MANLKLNNVVVVTESAGAATVRSGIFKAKDGTAAFTVADSTGAATFTGATTLSSTLGVTGAATLSSTLAVSGTSTLTGNVTAGGNLTVTGDLTVNGTNTTLNTTTLEVEDKHIEIAKVGSPSDTTADGGGIIIKGASDKSILWANSTDSFDINQHVFPSADNTSDLGSAAKRWRNIYTTDLHLNNERGDWTIIEEEDYLSLRNNKNNKMYKLVMEEIE
jgi:hypothetical protein